MAEQLSFYQSEVEETVVIRTTQGEIRIPVGVYVAVMFVPSSRYPQIMRAELSWEEWGVERKEKLPMSVLDELNGLAAKSSGVVSGRLKFHPTIRG